MLNLFDWLVNTLIKKKIILQITLGGLFLEHLVLH